MSIIIGSKTRWECDEIGCRNVSPEMYDQAEAAKVAYRLGWYKNPKNGQITCPACRWPENKPEKA